MNYEDKVRRELANWEMKILTPPGLLERSSKKISEGLNRLIPSKVHRAITAAVKTIVRAALLGADYTPKSEVRYGTGLMEADERADELISLYQKIAAMEGAGTGAGGILLAAVDFPALIAIKMKFLFEMAHAYGFSTAVFSERMFILHLFRLTYANTGLRPGLFAEIRDWPETAKKWQDERQFMREFDWEQFQKDYRDALDFRKMLQLLPGIGAAAGAWANYGILEEIGENAKNGYRLRLLQGKLPPP